MNDKIVMPFWMFGLFIVVMNTTMFNVSIPSIIEDLQISTDLGSWVISSYSIGYALSTVIYSRLSDTVSIRKLMAVGLIILGASSAYGFFAHDFQALLTARILQSAGAGAMAGLGLVLVSRYIPSERRGRAIAMITTGSAMAFGLGPIVGGVISENFGWNGLFAITCLVFLVLPFLWRMLPQEKPQAGTFDVWGAFLTVVNASTLLIAVTQQSGLWLVISILSFLAHIWHLKKAEQPFINPELLKQSSYRKLLIVGFCILVMNLGNLFLMPLALANVFNLSAMMVGLMIAPGAILSVLLTSFVGRWIDRYGNVKFLLIGHCVLAAVLFVYAVHLSTSPVVILCGYLFFSPAFSATIASLNNETSQIIPKAWIGSGMGFMQLIQFFGGSISVAICGYLLERQNHLASYQALQHVYGIMLLVCTFSLGISVWYKRSSLRSISKVHE